MRSSGGKEENFIQSIYLTGIFLQCAEYIEFIDASIFSKMWPVTKQKKIIHSMHSITSKPGWYGGSPYIYKWQSFGTVTIIFISTLQTGDQYYRRRHWSHSLMYVKRGIAGSRLCTSLDQDHCIGTSCNCGLIIFNNSFWAQFRRAVCTWMHAPCMDCPCKCTANLKTKNQYC